MFHIKWKSKSFKYLLCCWMLYGSAVLASDGHLDSGYSPVVLTVSNFPHVVMQGTEVIEYSDSTNSMIRLNTDGAQDSSFVAPSHKYVLSIVQSDNKILAAYGSGTPQTVIRLNADGSVDSTFTAVSTPFMVDAMSVQPDNKILIGGGYGNNNLGNLLFRVNADGTADTTFALSGTGFTVGSSLPNYVGVLTIQPDNKILVGGLFDHYNGLANSNIVRLNTDGTLDSSFSVQNMLESNVSYLPYVDSILLAGNNIIIGGTFTSINGISKNMLAEVDSAGTLVSSFTPPVFNEYVTKVTMEADGKLLVAGTFTSPVNYMIKLNTDGSQDASFTTGLATGVNGVGYTGIYNVIEQPDGNLIISGEITTYDGTSNSGLVRVFNHDYHHPKKLIGDSTSEHFGQSIAVYDMDKDGFTDIIVGSPNYTVPVGAVGNLKALTKGGRIQIFSGADGSLLKTFYGTAANQRFGTAITGLIDQTGDNWPDLVIGNPWYSSSTLVNGKTVVTKNVGSVDVYDGQTGTWAFNTGVGTVANEQLGASLALGNVTNNPCCAILLNLVIGAPGMPATWYGAKGAFTALGVGAVYVMNAGAYANLYGQTNAVYYGDQINGHFGASVAVDNINYRLIVGEPNYENQPLINGIVVNLKNAGQVAVYDGTNPCGCSIVTQIMGMVAGAQLGYSVASFDKDIDGDGQVDWTAGSPYQTELTTVNGKTVSQVKAGQVQVYSGVTPTYLLKGAVAGDTFGTSMATGDINGDGNNELAIGALKAHETVLSGGKSVIKQVGNVCVFDVGGL